MSDIALGVVVLNRVDKLSRLLESVENTPIETVYVADNGKPSSEKEALFGEDFDFELRVLDLEYDIGLGSSRDAIVSEFEEEYLMIADSDHEIVGDVSRLVSILEERDDIGGVAGSVMEPRRGRIWQSAKDFYESGSSLIRTADEEQKNIEYLGDSIFIRFDFVPYPAMYKRDCLIDYSWDPEYPLGRAHVDFYVGHWKQTDWKFGICPQVHFGHYPGGNRSYTSHRRNDDKYQAAKEHFREKWGYKSVETKSGYWYDTDIQQSLIDKVIKQTREKGVSNTILESIQWAQKRLYRRI